jgi:hypothetical protein
MSGQSGPSQRRIAIEYAAVWSPVLIGAILGLVLGGMPGAKQGLFIGLFFPLAMMGWVAISLFRRGHAANGQDDGSDGQDDGSDGRGIFG